MEISQRDLKIIEYVKTHSQKDTGLKFNCTQSNISRICKKYGIVYKKSRYNRSRLNLDVEYFKNIDTEKKAYWLGFICADGYIFDNKKLSICIKDLDILEKFKKDIRSEHKICTRKYIDKRTNKSYTEYLLQVCNETFVNYLMKWVTHNKTDVLNFPKINEKYYSYFIAGLFDGDGSIYLKDNGVSKVLYANLISTKEVLDFIQNYFKKFKINPHTILKVTENKDNVYKVCWYKDTVKILDYIYQGNPEIYMSRKYNLYIQNRCLKPTRNRIQPVLQYNSDGVFIKKFNSLLEASLEIKSKSGPLCNAIKQKIRCKGYYWIKYNNGDPILKNINIKIWKI